MISKREKKAARATTPSNASARAMPRSQRRSRNRLGDGLDNESTSLEGRASNSDIGQAGQRSSLGSTRVLRPSRRMLTHPAALRAPWAIPPFLPGQFWPSSRASWQEQIRNSSELRWLFTISAAIRPGMNMNLERDLGPRWRIPGTSTIGVHEFPSALDQNVFSVMDHATRSINS